jgi:hypothetical protein
MTVVLPLNWRIALMSYASGLTSRLCLSHIPTAAVTSELRMQSRALATIAPFS